MIPDRLRTGFSTLCTTYTWLVFGFAIITGCPELCRELAPCYQFVMERGRPAYSYTGARLTSPKMAHPQASALDYAMFGYIGTETAARDLLSCTLNMESSGLILFQQHPHGSAGLTGVDIRPTIVQSDYTVNVILLLNFLNIQKCYFIASCFHVRNGYDMKYYKK